MTPDADPGRDGRGTGVPVVGIGASAGGVDALKDFFTAVPPDPGVAFVVIQHMEPSHESRMAEILGKHTAMGVSEAVDGRRVEADHVYTNPPGSYVSIRGGRLAVTAPREGERVRSPIDFLLASLAQEQGEQGIGVILSGASGTDGMRGVRAVHEAGGMCLAQDPREALFPAMPQSAIATGFVDDVLPAARMPVALLSYARHLPKPEPESAPGQAEAASREVAEILELLRERAKRDYRHYRRSTIGRRLRRRMGLTQTASLAQYLARLREDKAELAQLAQDLLIGVSAFFRDAEAFEELASEAIAPLALGCHAGEPLRAWVAGCSTGEEAYSLALLLLETVDAAGKDCPVQVFATDVDERALETARAGLYPDRIVDEVSPSRLERFFSRQGRSYRVVKRLREAIVFSRQDLVSDPPFSKLDLVSCRNVLIYLEPHLQRKVLSTLAFSLKPGGFLFLGKSEGIADLGDVFQPVSRQRRIFQLVGAIPRAGSPFPVGRAERPPPAPPARGGAPPPPALLAQVNQEVLLRHWNAAVVIVNPQGKILHFFGETERYLGHPQGPASLNVLDMTGGTLSLKLRRALDQVLRRGASVTIPHVPVPGREGRLATVTVTRVESGADAGELVAVFFEGTPDARPDVPPAAVPREDESLVAQLEDEVRSLRNELLANAEEFDRAREDLTAANEEVVATNEELQSANEELEASREELQAMNEELSTVNSQLAEKVNELTETNSDLDNLFLATEIGTVFLDGALRIKRYTPTATALLNLIPSDLGRPIDHITQKFDGTQLAADAGEVVRTLAPVERELRGRDGRWYTVRLIPYRTGEGRVEGVVVTFDDVTFLKEAEQERAALTERVRRAQKLESLGVLAGGIAHDFNNILTAVVGYLELAMLDLPADAKPRRHLEEVRTAALEATKLAHQMLTYAGRGVFNVQPVDLNAGIVELQALLASAVSKKARVHYDLAEALPPVQGDLTQLKQVVLNLMTNASESLGEGGGEIRVTTRAVHADAAELAAAHPAADLPVGDYVLLQVSDTGSGMDNATRGRVFEPFFTTRFTGRGLGLAVVQGVVKSHHGAISIESAPGRGTTFRVLLPLGGPPPREAAPEPVPAAAVPAGHGGGSVLVIDDEAAVRRVTCALLEAHGFSTYAAANGDEGLEVFAAHPGEIDAVLLDLTMPGMDAVDVLARLRASKPEVVVLLSTGYSEAEVAPRFAGKGLSGILQKPYISTLVPRLSALLADRFGPEP